MTNEAKKTPGYDEFQKWRTELEAMDIGVYSNVNQLPSANPNEKRLAIISARTADNPKLFADCLDKLDGCNAIFIEKPGATTVAELEVMKASATVTGVDTFVGFNKNVSAYLQRTRQCAQSQPSNEVNVTFLHNNNYSVEDLPECFERNAEGMLKNMAIHELAILCTYYGVTVSDIQSVVADLEFSSCRTLTGPTTGESFTDFDKIKFEITTKAGTKASVAADRCGGDDSVGIVTNGTTGEELARFSMPDDSAIAQIPQLETRYPGAMPYFFTQDPDYLTIKERVAKYCVDGTNPEGVATLQVAIDTLKLAEYLTPLLQDQLS
jgi:predicted dehydrogenase